MVSEYEILIVIDLEMDLHYLVQKIPLRMLQCFVL